MTRGQRNGAKNGSQPDFEEDPPPATDTNGHGNNSSARAKAIDGALVKFYELQKEEDRLLEKHIEPIGVALAQRVKEKEAEKEAAKSKAKNTETTAAT